MVASAATPSGWVTHPWVEESAAEVRFGIGNGPRGDWSALSEFVAALEELGFDGYWSSDHPVLSPGCWTTLAALAASTRTIRLGSLVACVDYLNPVVLARTALDIDQISAGRLVVGLGIGDFAHEFSQMNLPWSSTQERQERLGELIVLLRYLWGEGDGTPPVTAYGIDAPPLRPGPVQRPRIPLLIAGGGEKVTLRQVAQYADASNFGEHTYTGGVRGKAAVVRRMEVLDQHCAYFDRPPASVLRTHGTYPLVIAESPTRVAEKVERYLPPWVRELSTESLVAGTPDEAIAHFSHLLRAGLQYFIAFVYGNDLETIRLLAEKVIPEVRRLKFQAEAIAAVR
jgi:alkanesulfonate monooxygenase SsuD/methylene tetrahydromethanopterin reductase-like flavin-dependent oxidoreductase (luciferase family)